MTVSSTTTRVSYSGNGTTVAFPVPFYFLANSHLLVVLRSSAGVETTQVLGTNYTVTGAGVVSGGTVTMTAAPASGVTLLIIRNAPYTQETDFLPNDRLPAESLEQTVDKLTMLTQQLEEASDRSLKYPVTDSTSISSALPTSNERAGKFLKFNNVGAPTVAAVPTVYVSVKDFGAVGDGNADDTAAIQAAVNAAQLVFFPAGTYKVSSAVNLRANNTVFGEGASSIINYIGTATSQGAFFVNSGSASAYVDNITIRDLKVVGQVATLGFSEFVHNISLGGVRNCLIERCFIEGFRGDGIILTSGDIGGQERHNVNVTIRDCYIDGINKDNRNGISVIDCDGLNIDNNYITRCSKNTMPGAIDIEPDSNVYHVVRDISIRNNKIYDLNQGVAAIGVYLPGIAYTTWPTGFNIENNYIDIPSATTNNAYGFFFQYGSPFTDPPAPVVTDSTPDFGIRIRNNFVKFPTGGSALGRGFVLWNCNDVVMDGNTFTGGSASLLGYPNTNVINFTLSNNEFISVNGAGDYAVSVFNASRLTIEGNIFKDCGGVSGAARGAIEFSAGNFIGNSDFDSDTVWTKGTGWTIAAGVATKTAGTESGLSQTMTPTSQIRLAAGATYQLVYTITRSAGSITPRFTGGTTVTGTTRSASGTYIETITALAGNTTFEFLADASFAGTVDNVALRSGTSSYVKINGNTFTSPGGSFTQQAVRDSSHTFTPSTNTFIGNALINGANQFLALLQTNNNGVGFNAPPLDETYLQVRGTLKSNGGVSLPVLVDAQVGSSTTNSAVLYRTAPSTEAASFTVTNLIHYQALQGTKGAGSTITNQFGFAATDTLIGGGTNFGFYGAIPAGAGRYNAYMAGTADNYFAGNVGIDWLPSPWGSSSRALQVTSNCAIGADEGGRAIITHNAYRAASTYVYINTAAAMLSRMNPVSDRMDWSFAPSGTAGNTITFTQHLGLYSNGQMVLVPGVARDLWHKLRVGGTLPSDSGLSVSIDNRFTVPSATTAATLGYQSFASTEAASFTLPTLKHYSAEQGTFGAGSTVTDQIAFFADGGLTGGTNNYGFFSAIAAGSNRWGFYSSGTARNYFAGGVEVVSGTTTMASGFTHIPAAAGAPTGAPTNPSGNVPMYYDSTNHKIYVYSGGSWRSTAALT